MLWIVNSKKYVLEFATFITIISCGFLVLVQYPSQIFHLNIPFPFNGFIAFAYLFFYFIGLIIKKISLNISHYKIHIVLLILGFVLQEIETRIFIDNNLMNLAYTQIKFSNFVFSTVSFVVIYDFINVRHIKNNVLLGIIGKIFKILGDHSYAIYLSHYLIIFYIKDYLGISLMEYFLMQSNLSAKISFCLSLLIVLFIDLSIITLSKRLLSTFLLKILGFN